LACRSAGADTANKSASVEGCAALRSGAWGTRGAWTQALSVSATKVADVSNKKPDRSRWKHDRWLFMVNWCPCQADNPVVLILR